MSEIWKMIANQFEDERDEARDVARALLLILREGTQLWRADRIAEAHPWLKEKQE